MVKNDFVWDIATLCHEKGVSQAEIARQMGVSKNAINKRARSAVIVKGFADIVEVLGYDIEVRYIKR